MTKPPPGSQKPGVVRESTWRGCLATVVMYVLVMAGGLLVLKLVDFY